jgi:hypothetical protein
MFIDCARWTRFFATSGSKQVIVRYPVNQKNRSHMSFPKQTFDQINQCSLRDLINHARRVFCMVKPWNTRTSSSWRRSAVNRRLKSNDYKDGSKLGGYQSGGKSCHFRVLVVTDQRVTEAEIIYRQLKYKKLIRKCFFPCYSLYSTFSI